VCTIYYNGFLPGEGALDSNESKTNRETTLSQLAKTEISLTLTSKFELLEGDDKDLKSLMTKYVLFITKVCFPVMGKKINCSSCFCGLTLVDITRCHSVGFQSLAISSCQHRKCCGVRVYLAFKDADIL
jgi:hypothetical protein